MYELEGVQVFFFLIVGFQLGSPCGKIEGVRTGHAF